MMYWQEVALLIVFQAFGLPRGARMSRIFGWFAAKDCTISRVWSVHPLVQTIISRSAMPFWANMEFIVYAIDFSSLKQGIPTQIVFVVCIIGVS
jgi:hypothetical protein